VDRGTCRPNPLTSCCSVTSLGSACVDGSRLGLNLPRPGGRQPLFAAWPLASQPQHARLQLHRARRAVPFEPRGRWSIGTAPESRSVVGRRRLRPWCDLRARTLAPSKQKLHLSGAFLRADARTRTGDPFITREFPVRVLNPIWLKKADLTCRGNPRLTAFHGQVRPWCDLMLLLTGDCDSHGRPPIASSSFDTSDR
jgi:hypothetical protein